MIIKSSSLSVLLLLGSLSLSLFLSLPAPVFPFLLPPVAPADLAVVDPVLARVKVAVVVAVPVHALFRRGSRLRGRALGLRVRRRALVPVHRLVGRRGLLLGLLCRGELGLVGVLLGALGLFGLGELVWLGGGGEGGGRRRGKGFLWGVGG